SRPTAARSAGQRERPKGRRKARRPRERRAMDDEERTMSGARENPLLVVDNITLRFGGVTALNGVSFDVRPGELFAVIGPNGAGKSSIFNCLNGVYRPQEGSITLEGSEVIGMRPAALTHRGIARTFQNLGLFSNLDVVDNL